MVRIICLSLVIALFMPAHAWAEKACIKLDEAAFRHNVLKASEVVAVVEVLNYSRARHTEDQWTEVALLDVWHSRFDPKKIPQQLTISFWQADAIEGHRYKVGDRMLVLLRQIDTRYELTQDYRSYCVPSIMPILNDGTFYPNFQPKGLEVKAASMSADDLRLYLLHSNE